MVYMACSRNVDHSVCSDDVADLAYRFFALFIVCRFYSMWKIYLTIMFLKFEGFLYAQIGVTSNGCLEDVNLL